MMDIFPAALVKREGDKLGVDISTRYPEQYNEVMTKWEKKGFVQVIFKAPESPASIAQNNFFHALLSVWWKSGPSFESYDDMRESVKFRHGVSLTVAISPDGRWHTLKPGEAVREDTVTAPVLVSWSKYTKAQRTRCIDGLIAEMEQGGILSSDYAGEYLEIINGVRDAA